MKNKRASLQIGVNTIVILVIAMILLGLAISFIRTIFNKAETVPGIVRLDELRQPATKNDPIRLDPLEMSVRQGESKPLIFSVYNDNVMPMNYNPPTVQCGNPGSAQPVYQSLGLTGVPPNTAAGGRIIITAKQMGGNNNQQLGQGTYLCKVTINAQGRTLEKQFSLEVTA